MSIASVRTTKEHIFRAWETRLDGQKGARGNGPSRARLEAMSHHHGSRPIFPGSVHPYPRSCAYDPLQDVRRCALGLARMASLYFDEHGSTRGDHFSTVALDYIAPQDARAVPYFDMGSAGLGLIRIDRKRVYARSYGHSPGSASTTYIVGRNETGTFFGHAVPHTCATVREAVEWIWQGRASQIVRRQGDVAVVRAAGPKMPSLPSGHQVVGSELHHATHPAIALPGTGERLIVARRATVRVSEETRD